jgi:nitric oxide reductase NorD protein
MTKDPPETRTTPELLNSENEETLTDRLADALRPLIDHFGYEGIEEVGKLLTRLEQDDRKMARHLLRISPDLIRTLLPFGEDLVLKVFQIGGLLSLYGSRVTVLFLEMSPELYRQGGEEALAEIAGLVSAVARVHEATALKVLEKSPVLLKTVGLPGLEKVARFSAVLARFSWTYALRMLDQSPLLTAQLLERGDKSLVPLVYDLAARLALEDWGTALKILEDSPSIAGQFEAQGLTQDLPDLYRQAGRLLPLEAGVIYGLLHTAPGLTRKTDPGVVAAFWRCMRVLAPGQAEKAATLLGRSEEILEGLLTRLKPAQVQELLEWAVDLAGGGSALAFRFLLASPALSSRLEPEEIREYCQGVKAMAKISLQAAEAFLEITPALLDRIGLEGLKQTAGLISPLSREYWETAARLLLRSPELIDRLGFDGLRMVGDFVFGLARESSTTSVQLLDKCPKILDRLLQEGGPDLVARVCTLGSRTASGNARLALSLLENSPAVIQKVGFEGLQKLEALARQLGQESWTAAVALMESGAPIIERVGWDGLEQIAALARLVARENSYGAITLLGSSPGWIDGLSRYGKKNLILQIYKLAESVAPESWRLSTALLEKSPDILARLAIGGLKSWVDLMQKTARVNSQTAVRLLERSPDLLDRLGFSGLEKVSDLLCLLSPKRPAEALAFMEKISALIDPLAQEDRNTPLAVLDLAVKVAASSPLTAVRLLEKSPEFLQWVGLEGLGLIAVFIQDTAARDEEEALAMLSGSSPTFADFLGGIPKGLELQTIKPVLSTYLKALLGRRVEIAEAETVYTDGQKIYLPARVKEFQENSDNFTFYKVSATHQEAHLEYGSFEFDLTALAEDLDLVRSRYGLKEPEEASDIERFVSLFPEADLVRDLFNLFEDFRIEAVLKSEYPALGREITRMGSHQLAKRRSPMKMTNPKQRLVEMIAQTLLMGKVFEDGSDAVFPLLAGTLKDVEALRNPKSRVEDAARAAMTLYLTMDDHFKEPYRPVRPVSKPLDQDMVSQNIGSFGKTSRQIQERMAGGQGGPGRRPQTQPEAESGAEGSTQPSAGRPLQDQIQQRPHQTGRSQRTFQGQAGGGKMESTDADTDPEEAGQAGRAFKYDSREKIERLLQALYREKGITPKEIERRMESLSKNEMYLFLNNLDGLLGKKTELESEKGTFLYPEWGEDINDYRSNWARIRELDQPGRSLEFYKDTLEKHAGLLKKIRREFQMLKPEEFTRLKRQVDGEEIDWDALVDYLVDRRLGLSPSEKNYCLHRKKRRDIAVAFLVDMSRSTKGTTIAQEKEALIIMSEALSEVGDAFAIYGFSGDNRDNVDFYRIKDFEDPYLNPVKKRISAIEDHFENRDGTAIRHAAAKLRKRAERTRMIILLSDGKPIDKDYSGPYAIEDTRLALKEAQHSGIRTFCITVDRQAPEYLPRMYSHSSWTVIDDVAKLPEKITRIYRMLTA